MSAQDWDAGYDDSSMNNTRIPVRYFGVFLVLLVLAVPALGKDAPMQIVDWPSTGTPTVRFTFWKFKPLPGMSNLHGYVMDTMAENRSTKLIVNAKYSVYLFDKNKVRVGEDVIALTNVGARETVKFETTVMASGVPAFISIQEPREAAKTISLTVNSTPQGAMLKLDGAEVGATPRLITVSAGKHTLTFSKEGFTAGNFPLEISRDDVSGGTVSYELGASAFDSIELRDGSVLNGDLVSIAGMDVEIRVGGVIQHVDRNKVKRVMFVHRDAPAPELPPATQPNP